MSHFGGIDPMEKKKIQQYGKQIYAKVEKMTFTMG
jgi:hypothetical protein